MPRGAQPLGAASRCDGREPRALFGDALDDRDLLARDALGVLVDDVEGAGVRDVERGLLGREHRDDAVGAGVGMQVEAAGYERAGPMDAVRVVLGEVLDQLQPDLVAVAALLRTEGRDVGELCGVLGAVRDSRGPLLSAFALRPQDGAPRASSPIVGAFERRRSGEGVSEPRTPSLDFRRGGRGLRQVGRTSL
jgi:hypothetical protein